MWRNWNPHTTHWCNYLKKVWQEFLKKLNSFYMTHQKHVHTKLFTHLTAILFILAKKWKQFKCPPINE